MAFGLPALPFVDALPCPFRQDRTPKPEPLLPPGHLRWQKTTVQGRPAEYGEAGEGPPVVFLHGWGLGHHTYKRALSRLALRGCRVVAPALPGFGGTAPLPDGSGIHAYGVWVDAFMEAVGIDEPAIVIGHSFGGGVSISLAHDYRSRVAKLVLVNSVGGAAWGDGDRVLSDRPMLEWGLMFVRELWPPLKALRLAFSVREDLIPNLLFNGRAMLTAGMLAANADLRGELEELRERLLPVVVMSGADDGVIPLSAFEALCGALGIEGQVLPGDHSWLLADPDAFDEVMANMVGLGVR
jgi:pimeloyl-ACP methyl ester carboxylesterase